MRPNTNKNGKDGWRLLYLHSANMVEWGIPVKILQNAVQTREPQVNRTLSEKVITKSNFGTIFVIAIAFMEGGPVKKDGVLFGGKMHFLTSVFISPNAKINRQIRRFCEIVY